MFTGIIEAIGIVLDKETHGGDQSLLIGSSEFNFDNCQLGDSIAVNGVCLTAVAYQNAAFRADVSGETLQNTQLNQLQIGSKVNLERAVTAHTLLGGHLVSGHVDGVATLCARNMQARSEILKFRVATQLTPYIARKGSVTLNGVSLTVNAIAGDIFDVNIVPHTRARTNLQQLQIGDEVNIEVDLLARYLEQLLKKSDNIDVQTLQNSGFIK